MRVDAGKYPNEWVATACGCGMKKSGTKSYERERNRTYGVSSAYIQFNIFAGCDRIVSIMSGAVPFFGAAGGGLYIFLYDKR